MLSTCERMIVVAGMILWAQTAQAEGLKRPEFYGRINLAIEAARVDGGNREVALKSYASRLGFRGEESIVDEGRSVFYGVEAQFLGDTGDNGLGGVLRNAYLGVKDERLGKLVVGRLDSAVNAPLYSQLAKVIRFAGFDTGNLILVSTGGRDTGSGQISTGSAGASPTGGISAVTQTILARQRVSNAIGYSKDWGDFKLEARLANAGNNDVVGVAGGPRGETDAREFELAVSAKRSDWFYGLGLEKDSHASAIPSDRSRFSQRIQAVLGYKIGGTSVGASVARNSVETNRTGVNKHGNEFALSVAVPVRNTRSTLIANYALRDLFGTDNTQTGQPLPLAGAKRRQFALGVHYDWTPSSKMYAILNLTDANSKSDNNQLSVYSMGLLHQF